eukprot:GEMP01035752.1.p1 GENE.GEMP01035752.1~~GEMP01035752.1.p1  ORF type:complete len:258 (+),score=34.72 GEMP01035752.1:179-952(+)
MGSCCAPKKPEAGLRRMRSWNRYVLGNKHSAKSTIDAKRYRDHYPDLTLSPDAENLTRNEDFFKNKIPSVPDGALIDDIHIIWSSQYSKLEKHHGYIQWLFPLREPGLNAEQQVLTLREAETIKNDPACQRRLLKSYDMMLTFYGMKKVDDAGSIERTDDWKARFANLVRHPHNFLRVTRILKSLGELGLEKLKKPWVDFLITEAFEGDDPQLKDMADSIYDYCIQVLRIDAEREECEARVQAIVASRENEDIIPVL